MPTPNHTPMKDTKERKSPIVAMVEKGLSLSRAARSAGVHRSTAELWKKNDEAFGREIQAAESRFILRMTDLITVAAEASVEGGGRIAPAAFSRGLRDPREAHRPPAD